MLFGYMSKDPEGRPYHKEFHYTKVVSNDLTKVVNIFFNAKMLAGHSRDKMTETVRKWINVGHLSELTLPEFRWDDCIKDVRPEVEVAQIYQFFHNLGNEPAIFLWDYGRTAIWYVWDGVELFDDMRSYRESQALRNWEKFMGKPERKPFFAIKERQLKLA